MRLHFLRFLVCCASCIKEAPVILLHELDPSREAMFNPPMPGFPRVALEVALRIQATEE